MRKRVHKSNISPAALAACLITFSSFAMNAQVTGSGTTNYIPVWTGNNTQGNSIMYQTSGRVGVNTTSPGWSLDVNGHINSSSGYLIGGNQVLGQPSSGTTSISVGVNALVANTTGTANVAVGPGTLQANTAGTYNTAVGYAALSSNTTAGSSTAVGLRRCSMEAAVQNTVFGALALYQISGTANTAIGYQAALYEYTGSNNTAAGYYALNLNYTGNANTADGTYALQKATGSNNTAVGYQALDAASSGSNNTALGYQAGLLIGTGSNNITIGNEGTSSDTGFIRIGTAGTHTQFYAAGVFGTTTAVNNAVPVMIDSYGQLGTVSSSIRFKEDVHDMGDASSRLLNLRPVTYRYKQPYADGSKPIDYGLIAEEVAEVYPDLVATNADGQPQTVQYQKLTPMLLNEMQKQHQLVEQQAEIIQQRLAALEAR